MEPKKWFPLAKQPIFISQNEEYASKIHFQFLENRSNNGLQIIESESALTNQNAGLVYRYVSVRQKYSYQWQAGVSKNRRKNGFHQPENQFPLAGIRLFFKKYISASRKTSPNKRILFQVDRKLVPTSRNGKFV